MVSHGGSYDFPGNSVVDIDERAHSGVASGVVGEWRGATFGACTDGIGDHGQSFSAEVQAAVEGAFEVEEVVRLPNWPLFLDVCVAWRRRPS